MGVRIFFLPPHLPWIPICFRLLQREGALEIFDPFENRLLMFFMHIMAGQIDIFMGGQEVEMGNEIVFLITQKGSLWKWFENTSVKRIHHAHIQFMCPFSGRAKNPIWCPSAWFGYANFYSKGDNCKKFYSIMGFSYPGNSIKYFYDRWGRSLGGLFAVLAPMLRLNIAIFGQFPREVHVGVQKLQTWSFLPKSKFSY